MKLNIRNRNGSWEYRFEVAKIDGKRKQISKSGFRTKKECEQAGIKAMNDYNGFSHNPQTMSYADFLDYWLESAEKNVKKSTMLVYRGEVKNRIKPALGIFKLSQLNPMQVQNYINDLYASGLAQSTCQRIKWIIKDSLRFAVVPCGLLSSSPAEYIRTPKCSNTKKKEKVLVTYADIEKVSEHFGRYSQHTTALMIAFFTGMRRGEIFALKWDDIDFKRQIVHVSRNKSITGEITTPKTKKSFRDIVIGQTLTDYLLELKKEQAKNKMKLGEFYTESGFVVVKEDGTPACAGTTAMMLTRNYNFTLHCFRHTHASILADAGIDAKIVQDRLGHANIRTTLNIYTHVSDNMKQSAVDVFEKIGGREVGKSADEQTKNA